MRRWRVEFEVLLALLVLAGGAWSFLELAEAARAGAPHGLDMKILLMLREPGRPDDPLGPLWLEEAVRDFTSLGSVSVLAFIVLAAALYLALAGLGPAALFMLAAIAGGQVLASTLKLAVDRPRPDLVPHGAPVFTLSFPSAHAMLSAVTYLTLGAMLARVVEGRALKTYVMGVAVLLTVLVGLSRLYLGVHWPSDVLAGWCAGAAWAMLCWLAARWWLSRRGPDESAVEERGGSDPAG